MTVAIQTLSTLPNKEIVFDFGKGTNVLHYVVGISYWKFSFDNTDQRIDTITLNLTSNSAGSQVTTSIAAQLQGGDHKMGYKNSSVTLSCVAILNDDNRNYTFGSGLGIPNGGRSSPITLCSSTPSVSSAFLSGFSLRYSGSKHHVQTIQTTAGVATDGSTGYITSQANMNDHSNNWAQNPTIDGGLIYVDKSQTGLLAQALPNQQAASPVSVKFPGTSLSAAAVMLQSLTVSYGSGHDHDIKHVGGGAPNWTVGGDTVVLDSAQAFMSDDSHNSQQNSDSRVSLIVLGIPA
ncbi:hypothetical protein [Enhygromyxa salina]|uniref:Uncharacterized protein n=1 Tax=Enhygromyxa salina TaxID=215803 RepID=A0A2S9YX81_9BACT|nr:hypothetical protein [Enhygromyxa salina]PRQ09706.1 hypothetical protein ENSA7_04600 [Enhygromyxa salina]